MRTKTLLLPLSSLLGALLFLAACTNEERNILAIRIDYAPANCNLSRMASTSLHLKHLQFARLLSVALNHSSHLRQAVNDASRIEGQAYFEEILVRDFLDTAVNNQTVRNLLSQYFSNIQSETSFATFQEFVEDLLQTDPLLVIKIPDWFFDENWDIAATPPDVVSNILAPDQLLYGFRPGGACFSKVSYFEFGNLEMVVKTSEDYLWVGGPSFLEPFPQFCMSHDAFFAQYARNFSGGYLIRKRDLQRLCLGCGTGPTDPDTDPPTSSCPRDEGFDHNYLIGFRLAHPNVIITLNNQPCLGGEETYDFQIDFLYALRTAEQQAQDLKLPPLPLYGLRFRQLVDIRIEQVLAGVKRVVAVNPVYHPIRINDRLFNYFEQISPSQKEWVVNKFGKEVYIAWSETDFVLCTSSGVTTVTNTVGAVSDFNLLFNWFSKTQNPKSTFNTSYSRVSQHTVAVYGAATVPLGFCGLGYCDSLYSNDNSFPFRPRRWYPTGPQALWIHCDYIVE